MVQRITSTKNLFFEFYQRHEVAVSGSVFVAGFIFDLLTLGRIDDLFNLVQQAIYLTILGSLLVLEARIKMDTFQLSERGLRFWKYHDLVVHFLFGSLLSAYTIFYYTSASALTSFIFIVLLSALMLANEIPRIQRLGLPVRVILFCICLLSYCSFFWPILLGHVGQGPFWLGILSSILVVTLIGKFNFVWKNSIFQRHVMRPAFLVHLFFLVGYYFSLIPPVPVAVKKIGVYYEVSKVEGDFLGKHLRPNWKIWQKGSQTFKARSGDKVIVLLSVFSPARFEDRIFLKWWFDDPNRGWVLEDTIPLSILGGRSEGFRGYGSKQFYSFGTWKVIVETSDGREVGQISLSIERDEETEAREFYTDVF